MTIPQAFDLALRSHQAGRMADAESLCRQILAAQPSHPDAAHMLGVIAHQVGRHDLAVEWLRRAVALNPNNPAAHSNLGEACRAAGRLDEAMAAYLRALQIKPDFPEAHSNLGNALRDRGRLEEAVAHYRRALEIKPDYPEAHNNLGNTLRERGQPDEATAAFRRALQLKPDYAEAHNNLGNALMDLGQLDEAVAAYRRALEVKPNFPEALSNMGNALSERGQFDEAAAACRRSLGLRPCYPEALNNLGVALVGSRRIDEAVAELRRALELKPEYAEAHYNLGIAHREGGHLDEAIASYERALQIKPDYVAAHNNLGIALGENGRLEESIAEFRSAIRIKPDFSEAYNNLGHALKDRGELDEAIGTLRHALQLKPQDARAHSNLIYTLHFQPGHDDSAITEERERWNRQFGEPLRESILPHANDRGPGRRLRVGYVSPDFRAHVVGRYVLPLFECHDRDQFEILCYAGASRPDSMTERFRALAGEWRDTFGVSDARLAEMIRTDRVDILVDLTQHMAGNRLPMFARKPAPVQVSFAGYPESAGLEAIEYRISDRYLEADALEDRPGRKEEVCLIDSFWCYHPCGAETEINPLPALEGGGVTFGCLNNFCKVNDRALSLWARALGKVKDSRLIISSPAGSHRQRTLDALDREGVAGRRVEFVEYRPWREYLETYHRLDIVLDTFPYNGGVTTCDALWMGVPVVSLAGKTAVARSGLSLLTNLGLPELIARSESEYVSIAESLAGDLPRLTELRTALRARLRNSPLMDAPRFARNIEAAYRFMWERWAAARG